MSKDILAQALQVVDNARAAQTVEVITAGFRRQIEAENARRARMERNAATEARLREIYAQGRKTDVPFDTMVSRADTLPVKMVADWNTDLLRAYVEFAQVRRPLTPDEMDTVAASSEVHAHGLLPCCEPMQAHFFCQRTIRITKDDDDGSQLVSEVRKAIKMAQAAIQEEEEVQTLYVRYQANTVVRKLRGMKDAPRARFGGRLYISDQENHSGILVAIVTPNEGARTALGKVEWVQPGFAPKAARKAA